MRKPLQAGALALMLFAASCGGDSESTEAQASDTSTEEEAPAADAGTEEAALSPANFVAPAVGGGTVDASAIEGDVIFWFWAPW